MPLIEHVHRVAIVLKMTEWVEQGICTKFYIKIEHSSMKTIRMIQKAAAMGNWWLAASSGQCTTHASHLMQSFLAKLQITQVTQPPLQPRFGALHLLAEITFEREEISDRQWDSENYGGAADGNWENCVTSQGA